MKALFYVTNNCVLDKLEEWGVEDAAGKYYQVDKRLGLISYGSTCDASEYLNYLDILKYAAERNPKGRNVHLLGLGYIPVLMGPTYMQEMLYNSFLPLLKDIPYQKLPATSFRDFRFEYPIQDIWVHKIDAAEFLGCKPENVTSKEFIMGVLRNANT